MRYQIISWPTLKQPLFCILQHKSITRYRNEMRCHLLAVYSKFVCDCQCKKQSETVRVGGTRWESIVKILMKVPSHPGHSHSKCCIIGNFQFLETSHLRRDPKYNKDCYVAKLQKPWEVSENSVFLWSIVLEKKMLFSWENVLFFHVWNWLKNVFFSPNKVFLFSWKEKSKLNPWTASITLIMILLLLILLSITLHTHKRNGTQKQVGKYYLQHPANIGKDCFHHYTSYTTPRSV